MIDRTTAASQTRLGIRAQLALAGLAAVAAMAFAPSPAAAIDNNREDAGGAVAAAVKIYYRSWLTKGRTIRVSCAGTRNVFNCDWWIIRGRFGYKPMLPNPGIAPLATAADSKRVDPGSVALSGQAQATWACKATGRKGRCTTYGFNVSLG